MWTRQRTRASHHPLSSWSWLYTAVWRGAVHACVCVRAFACVRQTCVFLRGKEQRLHLVRATECASMKHFCHSRAPFWSGLEVEWGQVESGEGSHLRRPLTQGALSWSHSLLHGWVVPHTHVVCVMILLPYTFTSAALFRHSVITIATKRVKRPGQTLVISSPGSEGFIQGAAGKELGRSWGERRQRSLGRRISEGAGWDLDWWTGLPAAPLTPHCLILLSGADQVDFSWVSDRILK